MTTAIRRSKTYQAQLLATVAFGLALAGFAGTARAADPVEMTIVDRDTGQPLQVWRHDGRLFVAGQPGAGYCLRVTNHTGRRVLAILSVDGVNIYTGQTAGYGQGGYIYKPYETYDQCGWRKSLNEVAAFSFAALPDSYAALTGRPAEVGVVGMAVFYERVDPPAPPPAATPAPSVATSLNLRESGSGRTAVRPNLSPPPVQRREAPPPPEPSPPPPPPIVIKPSEKVIAPPPPPRPVPAPQALMAQDAPRTEKLGTAHGALEASVIHLVDFKRATSTPAFVRQIEYDTRENLVAAGVILPPEHQPQAFPSQPGGFVPDPPER
jgi:hypothetical protein